MIETLIAKQGRRAREQVIKARQVPGIALLDQIIFPDYLPDIIENEQPNLIPTEDLVHELACEITRPFSAAPVPGNEYRLQVFLDGDERNPVFEGTYTAPLDVHFPLRFGVPARYIQSSNTYKINYHATGPAGSENSDTAEFTVDRDPPNSGNPPNQLNIAPIVEDVSAGVPFSVTTYADLKIGDKAEIYIGLTEGDLQPVAEAVATALGVPITGTIPAEAFTGLGDATYLVRYRLTDRAGNVGQESIPVFVDLVLLPSPSPRPPAPDVPLGMSPDIIDRADAQLGVDVEVQEYTNWLPGDRVDIFWNGGARIRTETLPEENAFPLTARVPWARLYGNDPGPKVADATYTVYRGRQTFPSLPREVEVDLREPGPENPGPGPGNENLPLVTVQGGATSPSSPPNQILVADKGLTATAYFDLYEPHVADEEVQLYFDGRLVPGASYTVTGMEAPNFIVTLGIPASFLANVADNPAVPAYYTVTSPTLPNPGQSLPTSVLVHTFELGVLPKVEWGNAVYNGVVWVFGCDQRPWSGLQVHFASDSANPVFAAGDVITLEIEAYEYSTGTDVPIPLSQPSITFPPLNQTEAETGFTKIIPFSTIREAGTVASGAAYLSVEYGLVRGNDNGRSDPEVVYTALLKPSGCFCISETICTPSP